METLGIFAGGGDLPLAIAESAQEAGRPVFLLGLKGSAGPEIESFPHDWIAMGETGRAFKLLHTHNCGMSFSPAELRARNFPRSSSTPRA